MESMPYLLAYVVLPTQHKLKFIAHHFEGDGEVGLLQQCL